MKKLLSLAAVLLLIVGSLTACGRTLKTCTVKDLDGTTVCYDEKLEAYAVETGAKLRFGADNDVVGNAIVALWDATYPTLKGAVEYVNTGAAGSTDALATQQGEYVDVFMAIDGEVSRNESHLLAIDAVLAKLIKDNSIETFFKAGNTTASTVYAPMAYDGMAFIWNKTMLETLGLNTTDADKDNLPDAFDTWEEIFALSKTWIGNRPMYKSNPINIVFPLALTEVWSTYHQFTSTGWEVFAEGDGTKPGYEKASFKSGLDFLLAAKEAQVSVDAAGILTKSGDMGWRWDDVFNNETAPFGLAGTWMDIAGAATKTGSEFIISPLPTFGGNHQSPFVKTKGFVINGYTQYRSAATELLRLVYSKGGFDALVTGTSYAPSLKDKSAFTPTLIAGGFQEQMMTAFVYNYPEPAITLPNNTAKKAMDVAYYDGALGAAIQSIWDGTKTVDEAIALLIETTNAKIADNNK
ncbi:MAG: ABC transporter substrate-binding protein [Erysipelotrichales bacterium]|nr:MAG: ABC transporter substrate-binding protein [Erysipelotrichales bacterium]